MRRAHVSAARAFLVTVSGPEVWGWQGRTLGRRAGTDSPALDRNPVLPDAWWTDLRSALKTLATVRAYTLTAPATAARIRREFADVLDTPAGRAGEPVALGRLLQACSRGVHPRLAPLPARRAEDLTGTPVPLP
ncbi:hypothetical protein [Streptomyces zaomyceticus]|uniref:hypothetical protein n=1 Tax=Streptomyces zaomyceticus TaxID=68286 RepID=UPI0033AFB0FE